MHLSTDKGLDKFLEENLGSKLSVTENDKELGEFVYLVSFLKFKTIPENMTPDLIFEGFLQLYKRKDNPNFSNRTFIKLTYKGRKLATKINRVMSTPWEDNGGKPIDFYERYESDPSIKFLMHDKRFRQEFEGERQAHLLEVYSTSFDN